MSVKRLMSLSILSLALASSSAQAWWFFFIPGSAVSAIGDALTGSEGANCVSSVTKVGEALGLPDGSRGIVKSLSGTSIQCKNPAYPIRALVEPSGGPTSTFNSKAGIELPEGWESIELSARARANGNFFQARNQAIKAYVMLNAAKRDGVKNALYYAKTSRDSQMTTMVNARPSEIEPIQVNGMQAPRVRIVVAPI